jgi:two-component system, OmpR family, sensor histidine kinase VanS
MSLSTKLLILVILTVVVLTVSIGIVNFVFVEDMLLSQKEKEYTELASEFSLDYNGNIQQSYGLIDSFEDRYGLNVVIADSIGIILYTTVIKGNPWGGEAARWKNDNIYIPGDVREKLSAGEISIYYTVNEKYNTEVMNIAAPLMNDEILILETMLSPLKENIIFMRRFYMVNALGAIIIGLIFSYLISFKISIPISKLKIIAQRVSESDFSIGYSGAANDELGELGELINVISEKLRLSIKKNSEYDKKLKEDSEREKKSERRRQEFLSNASHELKTPLSVIQSYASALVNNLPSDEQEAHYYYRVIDEETTKLMELVSELLEISMLDREDNPIKIVNFDMISLIENVKKRYEKDISEKGIKYILSSQQDYITVRGDPYRIEQVIANLLTNAIKYAEGEKGVVIKLEKDEKKTIVKVFNTGKNIPYEEIDKIWESFYRVDRSMPRERGSTGLGLYIVKKILRMHDSRFGVRNLKGGVEFWFDIETF